jgi:AcrR family transcriptional regulator
VLTLTISQLEGETGVPRSTIHHYLREKCLPAAQKTATSRSLYTDAHVELLREIVQLRAQGLSLAAIRSRLQPRIDAAEASEVDLAARQVESTRRRILDAAARQFARKGYGRTRIADIVKEAGITPTVFYAHFKTKRQLFTRTFAVFIEWMQPLADEWSVGEPDLSARLLNSVTLYFGVQELSQNLLLLARTEALEEGGDARQAAQGSFEAMTGWLVDGLAPLRTEDRPGPAIPDELVAYSLLGALEHTVMRSSWNGAYSPRDVLETHLHVFLALKALYEGRLDVSDEVAQYADLIDALAACPPPRPPAAR